MENFGSHWGREPANWQPEKKRVKYIDDPRYIYQLGL